MSEMKRTIDEIIDGIDNDDAEAFLGGSELLRAHLLGLNGTSVLEPYASIYASSPLVDAQASELISAYLNYLSAGRLQNAPAAAHALAQVGDHALVPELRRILAERLRIHTAQGDTVGQLLLAIDQCGEQATTGGSFASDEYEKNAKDARQYLFKHGVKSPW